MVAGLLLIINAILKLLNLKKIDDFLLFQASCYHRYMKYLKKIRVGWLSLLGLIILFLLYQAIVPGGQISYKTDFSRYSYFLSELTPKERLGAIEKGHGQIIRGEPIYFFLKTPRPFRTAQVTVTIKEPSDFMEIGLCRDKAAWNFERQPLYIKKLEELALDKNTRQEGNLMFWQREAKYATLSDFLQSSASIDSLATYNVKVRQSFRLPDYSNLAEEQIFPVGIRGSYILISYSNGQPLSFKLSLEPGSLSSPSASTVTAIIYNEDGEVIYTQSLPKVDNESLKIFSIITPELQPGPYRLEIKAGNEWVTKTITTAQTKLAFFNQLWLADQDRQNFSLFTDGSFIKAQTINPENVQTIKIKDENLDLSETYHQFSLTLSDQSRSVKKIDLAQDDIMLATDGVFAFTSEALFNPATRSYSDSLDLDMAGIDYVIAGYEPIGQKALITRTVNFNLAGACLDQGRYPFLIAAPGLTSQTAVELKDLTIKLQGATIFELIQRVWKNFTNLL